MTITQLRKQQAKAKREALREKRAAAKARAKLRADRKREKRALKAAPKKALAAWSLAIRDRAGHKCEICGRGKPDVQTQAHHVLPKEFYRLFKLDLNNGVCLCSFCHKWSGMSAHKNPVFFVLWLMTHKPQQFEWAKAHLYEGRTATAFIPSQMIGTEQLHMKDKPFPFMSVYKPIIT